MGLGRAGDVTIIIDSVGLGGTGGEGNELAWSQISIALTGILISNKIIIALRRI